MIKKLCLMLFGVFFLGLTCPKFATAATSATIISTNLLIEEANVISSSYVTYNLSALPAGTTATIQFSTDGTNWYNKDKSAGYENLTLGTNNTIPLTNYVGSSFYYKIYFAGDGIDSPILDEVALSYKIPSGYNWSDWSPISSETQMLSLDSDASNWNWDSTATYFPNLKSNDSAIKEEGSGSLRLNLGVAQTDANTVALWHLDESSYNGTTGEIIDSTGVNHGTANSSTISTRGISNLGIRHQSDTASIPDSSSLNITSNLTIQYWFKPDVDVTSMANSYPIGVYKRIMNVGGYASHFNKSNGTINFQWCWSGSCANSNSTTAFKANNWYYYSATYDGTNSKLYINGVLEDTDSVGSTMASSAGQVLYLGRSSFEGVIDEVKISNIARTAEEIAEGYRMGRDHYLTKTISSTDLSSKTSIPFYIAADRPGTYLSTSIGESAFANYQTDSDTISFWHLDEKSGSGAYIKDIGGTNHGTLGTGTSAPTFSNGKFSGAYNFDGTNDYIDLGTINVGSPSITLSAWVNTTSTSTAQKMIIAQGTWSTSTWQLMLGDSTNAGNPAVEFGSGGQCAPLTALSLNDGKWHYITGVYNSSDTTQKIYADGVLVNSCARSFTYAANSTRIGGRPGLTTSYWSGLIDEVRIDKIARTPDEIRQAYEIGLRTHPITIDFAANLDSGNLVVGSTDYSFTIDATKYGLTQKGSFIYQGEKIIIKENVGGTEYIAQGQVSIVNEATGAVSVGSWDYSSTFPPSGYSVNASVFKWQREFWNITSPLDSHLNTSSNLILKVINGNEGRTVWLDDFKNTSGYLNTAIGSTITSTSNYRYFQYRSIFSSSDSFVSPSLSLVALNYENYRPLAPTLISPSTGGTAPFNPTFKFTTTDAETDYIQYKIEICNNLIMTLGCETYNQVTSQVGWSGQDAQSETAYASGSTASFIYSGTLPQTNYHYWRVSAIDPAGINLWSTTSSVYYFLSPRYPVPASNCVINQSNDNSTFTISWTDNAIGEDGYEIQKSIDGGAYSVFSTAIAPNSTSHQDDSITPGHSYSYKISPYYTAGPTYSGNWCTAGVSLKPNLGSFRLD